MKGSAARCEIVSDASSLQDLAEPWWQLWERCPNASPFQTPAWLIAWWQAFSPGELAAVAIWQGHSLIGLAPFYLERGAHGLRLLSIGISVSDYHDVLIDPAWKGEGMAAMAEACGSLAWQSWELGELAPGASALGLPLPEGAAETRDAQSPCPLIDLRRTEDPMPPRRRRNTRHALAAARRLGEVCLNTRREPGDFLDQLFRLHEARWRGRGEPGVLSDAAVQGFHRAALPELMRNDIARCSTLDVNGEAVAAYYGFAAKGLDYAYLYGLDPLFARISPGSILIGHAIDEAARSGAAEFHFLRGREDYKYSWGAVDRWNTRRTFRRAGQW